jgi:hypothetical protein
MHIDHFTMTIGITGLPEAVACLSSAYIDYPYKVETLFKLNLNGKDFHSVTEKAISEIKIFFTIWYSHSY